MTKGYFINLMKTFLMFYSKATEAGEDHQVDNDFLKIILLLYIDNQ